jgi:hypothetical protein
MISRRMARVVTLFAAFLLPAAAAKSNDPARREFLFGNLDSDWIQITTGRDIRLPFAAAAPLNYSFYPHAESGGQAVGCTSVDVMYRRHR